MNYGRWAAIRINAYHQVLWRRGHCLPIGIYRSVQLLNEKIFRGRVCQIVVYTSMSLVFSDLLTLATLRESGDILIRFFWVVSSSRRVGKGGNAYLIFWMALYSSPQDLISLRIQSKKVEIFGK